MSLDDRWVLPGATGTGKTTFNKALMKEYADIYDSLTFYVLDSKQYDDFTADSWRRYVVAQHEPPALLTPGSGSRVQVWQPLGRDLGAINDWFMAIFDSPEPAFVNVDEVLGILKKKGGDPPMGYTLLQTQGRSRHKTMATNMQEIAYSPDEPIKQATHLVAFRVVGKQEPYLRNGLLRRERRHPAPESRYGFSYLRMDDPMHGAIDYSGYKDFFGRK